MTERPDEPVDPQQPSQPQQPPQQPYGQPGGYAYNPPPQQGYQQGYGQGYQQGYGAPQQGWGGPPAQPGGLHPQERTWGAAAHWSALVAALVALAFLGPLIVMLTEGNRSAWVRRQAVESLNFQLSMLLYGVVGTVVGFILVFAFIGFILLPLFWLVGGAFWLVYTIIGAIKANNGEDVRYPLTIRMVG